MYPRNRFFDYVILVAIAVTSVQCSDDDSAPPEDPKSTGKSITSFTFAGLTPAVTATIDEAGKTIAVTLPTGTDVTALVPTIEVSEDASVSPTSGTAQNFTAPVTYTVTAEDGSKQAYTVTVTVEEEEIVCYASEIPEVYYRSMMYITYNTDNTVASVTHIEDGSDAEYRADFEYTDGKRSRLDYFLNDVLVRYVSITYSADAITVTRYPQNNDFEADWYYIYYLDGDRVTSYSIYRTAGGGTRADSAVFTYTNDNITHIDGYSAGEEVVWDDTMEYDDKPNPYAQVALTGWYYEYFNSFSLSKNNTTRSVHNDPDFQNEILTFSYTYDEDGLPLTRSIDGDPVMPFAYECR